MTALALLYWLGIGSVWLMASALAIETYRNLWP